MKTVDRHKPKTRITSRFIAAAAGITALFLLRGEGSVIRQIGDVMPDGIVYAGYDKDKPICAMPSDAPQTMPWKSATEYAAGLDALGHKDWRLPTRSELHVLFQNRAAIGGLNQSGSGPAGWYWSATETRGNADYAWGQVFGSGYRGWSHKDHRGSVRLVRSCNI
jgi:Protein of unknown function (DUF1566)